MTTIIYNSWWQQSILVLLLVTKNDFNMDKTLWTILQKLSFNDKVHKIVLKI